MNTLKVDPEQIEKVRKQYENTPLWMKAPNGMPTKLTEQQWLMVRTPAFKLQYGNWIKSYYTKGWKNITDNTAIKKRPPVVFNILNPAEDKKDIVKIFTEFGIVTNENDGRSVKFPANTAGRMVYKKKLYQFF